MLIRSAARAASTSAIAALSRGAAASSPAFQSSSSSAAAAAASNSKKTISAYMLLSRPPTILRSPTAFESSYHAYNSKIQRTLSQPFPRELYFKKGSAAESTFIQEEKARQEGISLPSSAESQSGTASGGDMLEGEFGSRRTRADVEGRTDTLERSLDRNLFLLVKGGDMGNTWTLPYTKVDADGEVSLHKAAPNAVLSMLGKDMDIWMVTTLPVGMMKNSSEIAYIMKGHILAGQPDASSSSNKGFEYAWLTREEVQEKIPKEQYEGLSDLLSA